MITFGEAQDKAIADWIHKEYGKDFGLLQHEYKVIFDERCDGDVEVQAGATILIIIPYVPMHPKFRPTLRHIADTFKLRDFLRGKSLIRREDALKWYHAKFSGFDVPIARKNSVQSFTQEWVTTLVMTDKKTKRRVEVKVVGSAFDAQAAALKLLYGDRLL